MYFTHRRSGRAGLRHLIARFLPVRVPTAWLLGAISLAPLCFTFSAAVVRVFTGVWPGFSLAYLTPQFILGILALGGPLNEELGWRGFALPRLLQRRSPLAASVGLGTAWAFWHLLLFFVPGATQHGVPLVNFVIVVVCFSIFMTAAHLRSRGSLLIAVLFHTSVNASLGMWHFAPNAPTHSCERWVSFQIVFLCLMLPWILLAGVIVFCGRRSWFVCPPG
jgi:membrane protease YdiL (CAAX protease family)